MFRKSLMVSVLTIGLLSFGIIAVYGPQLPVWLGGQPSLHAGDKLTYVTDLDFWQRTPRERAVVANAYFDLDHDLNGVPMQVGSWHGVDEPEANQEVMILLEPEQYIQRYYEDNKGHALWLTMVGGRNSQPFHAPDICYDADGWQYDLGSHATQLGNGGQLYGLWLDAHKQVGGAPPWEHIVYYFYLFPDTRRDQADGIVLFKITSGKYGTLEDTLKLHEDFTRQFFRAAASPAGLASAAPE